MSRADAGSVHATTRLLRYLSYSYKMCENALLGDARAGNLRGEWPVMDWNEDMSEPVVL